MLTQAIFKRRTELIVALISATKARTQLKQLFSKPNRMNQVT